MKTKRVLTGLLITIAAAFALAGCAGETFTAKAYVGEAGIAGVDIRLSDRTVELVASPDDRVRNLTAILDGYFKRKGHHLNINVYNRDVLLDAHAHPEKYPHLTIRVSGYAVRFGVLSYKHREEVLNRTFFERM